MAKAVGGSLVEGCSAASVRITAVVSDGNRCAAGSCWDGGPTFTSQSAPTSWCAVSRWLRITVARYVVDTTSRPTSTVMPWLV